ncbi:reverse transcriptase domain-containing protein, partial [Tanacetum coccineum]
MAEYSQKWHNGTSRGRSTKTSNELAVIQAQLNNLGREIEKVNEKVYAAQVGCEQCKGPHYTKDYLQKEEGKALEKAYYTQFGRPFQRGGYRVTALGHLDNHYCEEEGNYGPKFMKACRASHINNDIPQKEKDPRGFTLPCFINNFYFDNALVDLGASDSKISKRIAENVLVGIGKFTFPVDFIILDMPEDIKVPLILGRPFLSTARAKIDVYKRKITLRVGEEKIIFKSVKPASSIIKRVYMLSLRERVELDLEARLMGDSLVINRSLHPFLEDYIELNDLNEPFELRRNQGDDLMPTIKEGEVIKEFRTRNEDLDTGIDDYPSYCDDDKKIHIDCAHNLKFSCMIGFEFTHTNFFPLLYVNMMSRKFHNSIMKNKMLYKGNNVVGALMNVPIFVGTFSMITNFAVLENMDAYCDEGMGDVIFGKPFLREVDIKEKWFKGMITLYKGDDEVSYQMVRSHPSVPPKEHIVVELENLARSNEDLTNDQPQITRKPVVQPSNEVQPPPVPFPKRLRKEKDKAQQKKFLENLKQLHINLPFIKALAQMPKYAKFLKDLLTNKARLEESCKIIMNERCFAVLLNTLPSKEKDPGSFTIPYDIGQLHIDNALADLGASISLMPYTMYKKL